MHTTHDRYRIMQILQDGKSKSRLQSEDGPEVRQYLLSAQRYNTLHELSLLKSTRASIKALRVELTETYRKRAAQSQLTLSETPKGKAVYNAMIPKLMELSIQDKRLVRLPRAYLDPASLARVEQLTQDMASDKANRFRWITGETLVLHYDRLSGTRLGAQLLFLEVTYQGVTFYLNDVQTRSLVCSNPQLQTTMDTIPYDPKLQPYLTILEEHGHIDIEDDV